MTKICQLPLPPWSDGFKRKSYRRQQLRSTRKVRKHQQLPPLRSQHKRQKQISVFSVPHDIRTPEEILSFAVEIPTLFTWLTYLPILEWTWKKQFCQKPLRDNSVTFMSMSTSCRKRGCHFLSHEKIFWGSNMQNTPLMQQIISQRTTNRSRTLL